MEKEKLELFIGPCVLESLDLVLEVAGRLQEDFASLKDHISLTFKGSFDKANRTSLQSYRGPGLEKGLSLLEEVKKRYALPLITDFHLPGQADEVASVVDTLQVPAFLCRQTDMIVAGAKAAGQHGRRLQIKKGQFLGPQDCEHIVQKATASSELPREEILIAERGTTFGYNNLVVDMSSFQILQHFGVKAIYDATHSVQRPGGLGHVSGGKREHILTLAKAAVAAGADGVFMEAHPRPDKALSDAATSLPMDALQGIVKALLDIYRVVD